MYPTVREILELPIMRAGGARLEAGSPGLDNRVRWAHVAELADIAHLLHGRELVLTTGVALPDEEAALRGYVTGLAEVGVSGLVVELVQHWHEEPPRALVAAAEHHGVPLVTLSRETRYVALTEAVNGLIVDAQVAELQAAEQVHETFTELTVSGAEPAEVLREVARITGTAVVLETLAGEVLAYDTAGADVTDTLGGWQHWSAGITLRERTGYHEGSGALATIVGARGHDWARLVLCCGRQPPRRHVVVAERAASALAVHHLLADEGETLHRRAHRAVLRALLDAAVPPTSVLTRSAALGVPLAGRTLVGMTVRTVLAADTEPPGAASARPATHELADVFAAGARRAAVPALAAPLDDTEVRVLVSIAPDTCADTVLRGLADTIHGATTPAAVVAAGTTVHTPSDARRSLHEAAHVAATVTNDRRPAAARTATSGLHRLGNVRLRGLVQQLADDERALAFAARELDPLFAHDNATGSGLVRALHQFCANGGNKSAAAAAAHTSRTAYYQQLARIEQLLGINLDESESMLSLHVALLVHNAADSTPE